MKRRHSRQRRISTATMLLILAIIFIIITIFSFINNDSIGNKVFNVSTAIICLSISLSLFFNKDEAARELKEEERAKRFK